MIHGIGVRRGAVDPPGAGVPAGTVRDGITDGIQTPHGVPAATGLYVPTRDGQATTDIRPVKDRRERQPVPEATIGPRQVPTGALPATIVATIAGLRTPTSRMSLATGDTMLARTATDIQAPEAITVPTDTTTVL